MVDLRSFLETAKRAAPESVLEIKERHDIKFEVCALVAALEKQRRTPLLLFTNLNTLEGRPSPFPLLTNTFASRRACAMALGLPPEKSGLELAFEFQRREAVRTKPRVVSRKEAPVKEVKAPPNLHALPILTHHVEDKGPYLTMTWSARDLETGVYNSSFHRCYVRDSRHLVMFFERRHLWEYYLRAERRNEPLPVACVVGHHPAYYLGNCALTGIDEDEYESIGGIMGEPLRLVASETFGDQLLVPADAEMIIEGRLLPHERDVEGPFGDFTGYYGPPTESPIVEITALTHRRDALCMDIFVGHREHALLGAIPKEGSIYRKVQSVVPTVTAVCLPVSGTGRFHCYISIDKRCEGEAKLAAMAALTASELIKHVIVVDEDIDVYDEEQVLWAVATRVDAATDITIINRVKGSRLDPVHPGKDWGSKMIIDACRNEEIDFPNRIATAEYSKKNLARIGQKGQAMKSYRKELWFNTPTRVAFVNITPQVQQCLKESGIGEGLVLVNAMHITASVFINDDEAGLHHDYGAWLEKLAPHEPIRQYRHNDTGEDNADAHMKRQIMGREVVVAVTEGKLDFGPWEQIFYGEFDGRRRKRVVVKIIGE